MAEIDKSFLGAGWSFPPTFSSVLDDVEMVSATQDITESLAILFSTSLGERVKREDYGAGLVGFLFEPISTSSLALMKDMAEKAILVHEPRIRINDLVLESDINNGVINIHVDYTVRSTNSRNNFVYPFYLREGINI